MAIIIILLILSIAGSFGSYMIILIDGFTYVLLVLLASSLSLLYYSFTSLIRLENKDLVRSRELILVDPHLLACWTYSDEDDILRMMRFYTDAIKSHVKIVSFGLSIPIILIILAGIFEDAKLALVLISPFYLIVSMMFIFFRYKLKVVRKLFATAATFNVRISHIGLLINEQYVIPFRTLSSAITGTEITSSNSGYDFKIYIRMSGGRAPYNETYTVIIPRGFEEKAKKLKSELDVFIGQTV